MLMDMKNSYWSVVTCVHTPCAFDRKRTTTALRRSTIQLLLSTLTQPHLHPYTAIQTSTLYIYICMYTAADCTLYIRISQQV